VTLEAGAGEPVSLLRNATFRLLLVGQTTNRLGDSLEPVALAALVLQATDSAVLMGLVIAVRGATAIGFSPLGGVLADRLRRSRALMASDAVQLVTALGLAAAPGPAVLLVLAAVSGAAMALAPPAAGALVAQVVPAAGLQRANALSTVAARAVAIGGPVLGGLLVALVGARGAFLANAATFAVSLVCLALIREERRPAAGGFSLWGDLRSGLREIVGRRWVLAVIVSATVQAPTTLAPGRVLLPLVAVGWYGAPAYGLLLSCQAVGYTLGALLPVRWTPARPGLVSLLGSLAYPATLLLLAVRAPLPVLAVTSVAAGAALMFFGVVWLTALQREVPGDRLGRVIGVNTVGNFALEPVGAAAAGWLAQAVGPAPILFGAAVLGAATTLAPLAVPGVARFAEPG
jgi:MFS family permease